jgi:hypothetical protein
MKRAIVLLVGLSAACGSTAPAPPLSLAPDYDFAGVARVFADGIMPSTFRGLYIAIEGIKVTSGRVSGTVRRRDPNAIPAMVSGCFDPQTGQMMLDQLSASLTSTATEQVTAFGGRGDDIIPKDGIADEISGYLDTTVTPEKTEAILFGTQRSDQRPAPPADDKITLMSEGPGKVRVLGAASAVIGLSGVEVYRFQLAMRDPTMSFVQAMSDGSFSLLVDGLVGEMFILRVRSAGIASDGRYYRVTR